MQDSPIRIGSIDLQSFEVPSSVRFGGEYKLAIHRLASGQRVVERLGPDDNEIRFQGTFSGTDAEARVRAVNNLRLSGESIWLTWKSFRFLVIIKTFFADYHSPWWIPYQICCVVVEQSGIHEQATPTLADQISADLGTALSVLSGSSIVLSGLQAALNANNVAVAGTTDRANAIAAVRTSRREVESEINDSSSILSTPDLNTTSTPSFAEAFTTKVTAAKSLAAAVNARSYIARMDSSLTEIGA